ncbi:MAG: hypothetical protein RIQ89_236 [Bacteroidota bacterium]|jgi:hypothetical protein
MSPKNSIKAIKELEPSGLSQLARKQFPYIRKWLRNKGVKDQHTLRIFGDAFSNAVIEIKKGKINDHTDFNSYLLNLVSEALANFKHELKTPTLAEQQQIQIDKCIHLLDDYQISLLTERFVLNKSYEAIAAAKEFSNPVIAEHEVTKAFHHLFAIAKASQGIANEN